MINWRLIYRRCVDCEQEFALSKSRSDLVSHGFCMRHYVSRTLEAGLTETKKLNELDFCADMSQIFDG